VLSSSWLEQMKRRICRTGCGSRITRLRSRAAVVVIEDYASWDVVVNTAESVLEALTIESRHKISFWDALILQAAGSAGATVLYSEDLGRSVRRAGLQAPASRARRLIIHSAMSRLGTQQSQETIR
jgi:predicted nucleic acid-binding protein